MANESDLLKHRFLTIYGGPDSGKTQLALRLAKASERHIVYVDCSWSISERDIAYAGIVDRHGFYRLRPSHAEEASEMLTRCLKDISDVFLVVDPLTALQPEKYEIGGKQGALRSQVKFLNTILPVFFASRAQMIVVDHSFSGGREPVAALFADFVHFVT